MNSLLLIRSVGVSPCSVATASANDSKLPASAFGFSLLTV